MSNSTTASPPMRPNEPPVSHQAKQLVRWHRLIADLSYPDVELIVENVAPLIATFNALRRTGHLFDPAVEMLVDKLRQQLENIDEDRESEPDELIDVVNVRGRQLRYVFHIRAHEPKNSAVEQVRAMLAGRTAQR